uniref:Uncharacterized protein n=1 Tax=Sphaerodactylus townsendi TaxID=933632 RepID=A0ACB8F9V6_9SAUR
MSQGHFVAFNADLHSMGRSAFFPNICELPHLFIQSTDPFLRAGLELEMRLALGKGKNVQNFSVKEAKACILNSSRGLKLPRIISASFQMKTVKGALVTRVAQMQTFLSQQFEY